MKILNSHESRVIRDLVLDQWGANFGRDYAFLVNSKERVFLAARDIGLVDLAALRVNSMGLYFGELLDSGIRLSIDGSQLVGPLAAKGVLDVSPGQMRSWLRGEDISAVASGFVILRCGCDFIGCGRASGGIVRNFVPKTRRIRD